MSEIKYFAMTEVNGAFTVENWPSYAPAEDATSFAEAYAHFMFENHADAEASTEEERTVLEEAVGKGELEDFYTMFVASGTLNDDGSIEFEDGNVLTAEQIYSHHGRSLPAFAVGRPAV